MLIYFMIIICFCLIWCCFFYGKMKYVIGAAMFVVFECLYVMPDARAVAIPDSIHSTFECNLRDAIMMLKNHHNYENYKIYVGVGDPVLEKRLYSEFVEGKLHSVKEAVYVASNSEEVMSLRKKMQIIGRSYLEESIRKKIGLMLDSSPYLQKPPGYTYDKDMKYSRLFFDINWLDSERDYDYEKKHLVFEGASLNNGMSSLIHISFKDKNDNVIENISWQVMSSYGIEGGDVYWALKGLDEEFDVSHFNYAGIVDFKMDDGHRVVVPWMLREYRVSINASEYELIFSLPAYKIGKGSLNEVVYIIK